MIETSIQVALYAVVTIAAVTDLLWQRVPNWLTLPVVLLVLVLHAVGGGTDALLFGLTGMVVGFALLIGFYAVGGMGAGDVKLLAVVGACVGAKTVFVIFLMTTLLGGVYAIGLAVLPAIAENGFRATMSSIATGTKTRILTADFADLVPAGGSSSKLCYAVCIAAATFLAVGMGGTGILGRFGNFA